MKLLHQEIKEIINEDDVCVACGNCTHWGKPLLLEEYNMICFNGIKVEVTRKEMLDFKRSIKKYESYT